MPKFKKSSGYKMKGWSGYVSPAKDIQDGGYDHHENNDPNSPHVTKGDVQPTPTPTDPGASPARQDIRGTKFEKYVVPDFISGRDTGKLYEKKTWKGIGKKVKDLVTGGGKKKKKGKKSPAKDANPHTTTATHKAHGAGSTVSDEQLTRYMNVTGEEKPLTAAEIGGVEQYIKTESDKATKAGKSWTTMGEIRRRRGETKNINK